MVLNNLHIFVKPGIIPIWSCWAVDSLSISPGALDSVHHVALLLLPIHQIEAKKSHLFPFGKEKQ